ncbi:MULTISPECIES: DUF4097 family beta strand repeat-containing protein [Staphylococcus]|uniref:DUF4097 family beta strand repeat-containing protein n=1 Tax=Staphylococcus sp. GDY8P47P TaxID=2804491 RepID=UPI001950BE33|nr:DUF4097 family beta strand repeat-containing protein [Staphylococcus sp. GDY8P47P]
MKKAMIAGIVIFIGFFLAATLVWFVHDKDEFKKLKYDKAYNHMKMTNLNVESYNSEVTIKQGNHCGVKYYGDNDVKVYHTNDTLNVKEHRSNKRGYSININPFNQSESKIEIIIPNKNINNLDIHSNFENISLDGINIKNGLIYQSTKHLKVNNSKLNNLIFESDSGSVNIKNSEIHNSKFKTRLGAINVNKTILQNALFVTEEGHLNFTDMYSETDVRGSSKHDSIHLDYKDKPKNTLLKLHPGTGEAKVENKAFNNGKVGNSDNVVEFYTVKKDIKIK